MFMKNFQEKIPDILLAQLLTFSLVFALASSLCLAYSVVKTLLIIIAYISILFVMFYNKITSLFSWLLAGSTVLGAAAYIIFGIGTEEFALLSYDYFFWLEDYILYTDSINPTYQLITLLALCLLVSVFAYIFVIKKFLFPLILISGVVIFAMQLAYGISPLLVPFYLFLLAALLAYFKHVYHLKLASGSNEYAKPFSLAIWSLPVCILVIALASSFDASDKPIEWKWLDQKIFSAYDYFKVNLDYEVFDYFSLSASSGFGDRSNILGGRVRLDRTNVLYVNTSNRVYLKGVSRDLYTGTGWLNSITELTEADHNSSLLYSDYEEMMQGMEILTGDEQFLDNYFVVNPVTISFLNIRTKSLFIPPKVSSLKAEGGSISGFISDTGDYSSNKRLSKGFEYTANAYIPKIGSEEFTQVIQKSRRGLYEEALEELEALEDSSDDSYNIKPAAGFDTEVDAEEMSESIESLTALKQKSDRIYEKYLQLPDELPQRVIDLSASLVASAENDYDKAKAIEEYLAANYPYNLDVRSTPRDNDFVDYFLFDQKEGYCSYYASALAILSRCAGLPARYVEGYMLPPEPVKDSPNKFVVTNMQAHAWVEIYFEGYGWLAFEPTSPFRSNFYSTRMTGVSYGTGYDVAYSDYMNMMEQYANQDFGQFDFEVQESKGLSTTTIMLLALASLIILFGALISFNMAASRYRLYKLTSLAARESIVNFYDYYEKVLSLLGLGLMPSETPSEYSERIDSRMYFGSMKFKNITDIFIKYRYGPDEATEKEKQQVCDFYADFMNAAKSDMGKFKYSVLKYVLNKL